MLFKTRLALVGSCPATERRCRHRGDSTLASELFEKRGLAGRPFYWVRRKCWMCGKLFHAIIYPAGFWLAGPDVEPEEWAKMFECIYSPGKQ